MVLTLAGGTGILLYLVGWALIPDDQGGVIGSRAGEMKTLRWVGEDRTRKLVAAVVAGGGLLILLNQLTDGSDGDVALGCVLVGLGAAFLWSRRNQGRVPPAPGSPSGGGTWVVPPAPPSDTAETPTPDPSPAAGDAATAAESPTGSAAVETDPSTPPAAPAGPTRWPRSPRPCRWPRGPRSRRTPVCPRPSWRRPARSACRSHRSPPSPGRCWWR